MFRFCFLAMLLSLPLEGFGDLVCEAEIANLAMGQPIDGVNNYRSYAYDSDAANECNNLEVSCSASIVPNYTLSGRSWYITNIRPYHGLFYDDRVIQDFRVQCPRGTFLHLALQNSSLPSGDPFANGCEDTDFVRVNAEGLTESIFCGDYLEAQRRAPDLFNNGRGKIITNGRASVSFCSDNVSPETGDTFDGFVVRATCINPAEFQLPGCVDYPFFAAWDPQFTMLIEDLPPVQRAMFNHGMQSATPGKRAAERKKRMANREKRFLSTFGQQVLILEAGDFIQYLDDTLTITKNDTDGQTSETIGAIFGVAAEAARIGTRYFYEDAPLTFFGPGRVDIEGIFATIRYTIPEEQIEDSFLPRPSVTQAANLIHQYVFNNWVRPYPVIDPVDRTSMFDSLPLPPGEEPPFLPGMNNPLRPVNSLGFVREELSEASRCIRAVRIFDAPTIKSQLPLQLTKFCQFFSHSCDLILRHACQDANRLDPVSVGK